MFSSPLDAFAVEFEQRDIDIVRDNLVAADGPARIQLLDDIKKYTSIDRRTADYVRTSFVFPAVLNIIQKFTSKPEFMSRPDFEETVDLCSSILANCSGDMTQDRCPALVTYDSGTKFLIHFCDFVSSGTAWRVWDGALVMSSWLLENHERLQGKRCVEIGSGTGLTGLAAACITTTVLTDFSESVTKTLNATIQDNVREGYLPIGTASTAVFNWDHPEDWTGERFEVMIGSDVVFDVKTLDGVVRAATRLLDRRNESRFYCCCGSIRQCVEVLIPTMEANGFRCVQTHGDAASLVRQRLPNNHKVIFFEFAWT
eukprot:PhF_6_TR25710/c0_g1_i1/m.36235